MQKSTAVLLLHGFTGSPSQMQWLGANLERDGFSVAIPTLCGHDTDPMDLLQCSESDWLKQAGDALHSLQQSHKFVFVIGFSMGGAIALQLAAQEKFAGVITLAAPIKLEWWREPFVRLFHRWMPVRHKAYGPDIRDKSMLPDIRTYWHYPTRALFCVFRLVRRARTLVPQIEMPILVMQSRKDHTVPPGNARKIYERAGSTDKTLIHLDNSYHNITMDFDREVVLEQTRNFIRRLTIAHGENVAAGVQERRAAVE